MTNTRILFSSFCLTSMLSGCAGSSDSGSYGIASAASYTVPPGPCSTDFSFDDLSNRQHRVDLCLQINKERANHGLDPVSIEPLRNIVAQKHAADMAENNLMDHIGSDGSQPGERLLKEGIEPSTWGENVAWGATNYLSVMQWWMNSPEHRANILNPAFKHLGVGYQETRWVQVFTD